MKIKKGFNGGLVLWVYWMTRSHTGSWTIWWELRSVRSHSWRNCENSEAVINVKLGNRSKVRNRLKDIYRETVYSFPGNDRRVLVFTSSVRVGIRHANREEVWDTWKHITTSTTSTMYLQLQQQQQLFWRQQQQRQLTIQSVPIICFPERRWIPRRTERDNRLWSI